MQKKNNKSGGENNNNNDVAEKKNGDGGEKNSSAGGEKKKEDGPIPVVLKVDMHCEGCATKIVKCAKDIQGKIIFRPPCFSDFLQIFSSQILISLHFPHEFPPNFTKQCSYPTFCISVSIFHIL